MYYIRAGARVPPFRQLKQSSVGRAAISRTRAVIVVARIWVVLLLLYVYPQAVHRISRKPITNGSGRTFKTPNPLDDFDLVSERCNGVPKMETATVVMRGSSFDHVRLDELQAPIYLVNWPQRLERNDVFYATGDQTWVAKYVQERMFPILYVEGLWTDPKGHDHTPISLDDAEPGHRLEELIREPPNQRIAIHYRPPIRQMPALGGGLACVVAISKFAKRLEVYGWDLYFTLPPSKMSRWKLIRNLPPIKNAIESTIYNLHYGHRFAALPDVELHGLVGDLGRHKRLARSLDRVFYKT